jgi:hypothetical protein
MKLAAPAIIAAHTATLPTLAGWAGVPVYEGAALRRDDVTEFATIGYVAGAADPAVSVQPVLAAQGSQNRETGSVLCQVVTAQADVAAARARVFDLLAPWAAWLAADRTLGGALQSSELTLSADVTLAATRAGGTGNAIVTITYTASTYDG